MYLLYFFSKPRLFEHPDLFSSCSFFGPEKFAEIVRMINECNCIDRMKNNSRSSERLMDYSSIASSLQTDLMAVLDSYVGQLVSTKRPVTSSAKSVLSRVTGTIINSFIQKSVAYVVIEWHITARKTTLSLRQLLKSGQYSMSEKSVPFCNNHQSMNEKLKRRGVMKYT